VQNILAAVDFSPVTPEVIRLASRLAEGFSARLWLIHVAAPDPDFVGYEPGPQTVRDSRAAELHDEHRGLQGEAEALRARGIDATALLVQGSTVEKIASEAERLEAELVVVGSHGHGAVRKLLVGSVSEGLLRQAGRPVLVVPALQPS
jgi:nucleotide-binding universal stress UspA family protein